MATYTFTVKDGEPGYVFATDETGKIYEIYLQYAAVEPRIEDKEARADLVAQARAYRAPKVAPRPRDQGYDILDVRAEMRRAGFEVE